MQIIGKYLIKILKNLIVLGDTGISVSPPSILVGPMSIIVKQHSNASLKCNASGLPVPDITWSGVSGLSKNHVVKDNMLWLMNTTLADQGVYTCTASSVLGTVRKSALLTVHGMAFDLFM
jgi:hypothetical protein